MSKSRRNKAIKVVEASTPETRPELSVEDRKTMQLLYSIRAYAANGVFLTPVVQGNSTLIRLTFSEHNIVLNEHIPVAAVSMSLENVQHVYNAMGELLSQLKAMGRIA